jgi:hypothetical protein
MNRNRSVSHKYNGNSNQQNRASAMDIMMRDFNSPFDRMFENFGFGVRFSGMDDFLNDNDNDFNSISRHGMNNGGMFQR